MKVPKHNKILMDIWERNLNNDNCLAYSVLGIHPDGQKYSIHVMPGLKRKKLARVYRDAADALERGKNQIIRIT